jgi:hypothetical protein
LAVSLRPLAVVVQDSTTQHQATVARAAVAVVVYQEPLYLGLEQAIKASTVEQEAQTQPEQARIYLAVAVADPDQLAGMPQHRFAVAQVLALPRLLQGQALPEQLAGKVVVALVVMTLEQLALEVLTREPGAVVALEVLPMAVLVGLV